MTRHFRPSDLPPRPFRAVTLIERRDAAFHGPAHLLTAMQGRHRCRPAGQSCIARQGGQATLPAIL
ncbi:hypothetical protein [Paracoccus sp. R86501]|uniref:hypothetical protein n=1 Tax=Paracoccus sp. R86501 TaxID=3101711 RepID=UPI00366AF25F